MSLALQILKAAEGRPVDGEIGLPGLHPRVVQEGIAYLIDLGLLAIGKDPQGKPIYCASRRGRTFIDDYRNFAETGVSFGTNPAH